MVSGAMCRGTYEGTDFKNHNGTEVGPFQAEVGEDIGPQHLKGTSCQEVCRSVPTNIFYRVKLVGDDGYCCRDDACILEELLRDILPESISHRLTRACRKMAIQAHTVRMANLDLVGKPPSFGSLHGIRAFLIEITLHFFFMIHDHPNH